MATKHQFLLWAPFKAGPDFTARWDAHVRAHTSAGMALVAKGVISAISKHSRPHDTPALN